MNYERYARAFMVSVRASISSNPERGIQMAGEYTDVPYGLTAKDIKKTIVAWGQQRRNPDSHSPKSPLNVGLSWNTAKYVSVDNLFNLYIAFADDHHLAVDPDLYNTEKITQLFHAFGESTNMLDILTQLALADTITKGNIWASMHLLALTLRGVARDNDKRLGFHPPFPESKRILKRLPFMDDGKNSVQTRNLNTVGGDWYHFWIMTAFAYALAERKDLVQKFGLWNTGYATKFAVLENVLLKHSARITMGIRKVLAPPQTDVGGHYFADHLGRNLGRGLYWFLSADTGNFYSDPWTHGR